MLRKYTYIFSIVLSLVLAAVPAVNAKADEAAGTAVETTAEATEGTAGTEADTEADENVTEDETPMGEAATEDAEGETGDGMVAEQAGSESADEAKDAEDRAEVENTQEKSESMTVEAADEGDTAASASEKKYTATQLKLLACLIYSEAGNQPFKGKVAVANVALNRVASPLFPNSLKEVIFQKTYSRAYGRYIYQFSVAAPSVGTFMKAWRAYGKRTNAAEIKQEEECIKAAKAALEGTYGTKDTGYLFFCRYSSYVANSHPNGVKLSAHYFYR